MENEKDLIIHFLTESGFKENGRNAYVNENIGTIFIRQWNIKTIFFQIMELGEKHHAKKVLDVLMLKDAVETYIFNPHV